MLLSELISGIGKARSEYNDTNITDIVSNTERITKGCLFVCIKGLRHDTHGDIDEIVRRGAYAIAVEKMPSGEYDGVVFFEVTDSHRALSELLFRQMGRPSEGMKLIAVTGTNGKTTVSHMLASGLRSSGHSCAVMGTVGCVTPTRELQLINRDTSANLTTPDPEELYRALAEIRRDGAEYLVMETTSHALDRGKLAPLKFDIAIFTNLTPEHLDYHGSMDNYFNAKAGLLHQCATAVINADDAYAERYIAYARAHELGCRIVLCSASGKDADVRAEQTRLLGPSGIEYTLSSAGSRLRIRCPSPGMFNVTNSMQAAIAAGLLGISRGDISRGLASFSGAPGRLERLRLQSDYRASVFIDYAHTPDALQNILLTVRGFLPKEGRVILVFGCGGDRDREKRPIMGRIATTLADFTVITSDNCRGESSEDIIGQIMLGVDKEKPHAVVPDRRAAIELAVREAGSGDLVLLAGKGHEQYEIDAGGRHPFSEKECVATAVRKLLGEA